MRFMTMPGMALPLLTPPAAEPVDLDETGGDLYDADESDCAPEGTGQPVTPTVEDRVRVLERGAARANNDMQEILLRVAELEREQKRQAREQATALALEVRALDAAREVA